MGTGRTQEGRICRLCAGAGVGRSGVPCRCLGRPKRLGVLASRVGHGGSVDPFGGRFGDVEAWRGVTAWHIAPANCERAIRDSGFRSGNGESHGSRADGRCVWGEGVYCAVGEDSAALYEEPGAVRIAVRLDLAQPLFYDLPPPKQQVRDEEQIVIEAVRQLVGPLPAEVRRHYDDLSGQSWVDQEWLAENPWRAGLERWCEVANELRRQDIVGSGETRAQCAATATRRYLTELGYDGLVIREATPSRDYGGGNQALAFDPAAVVAVS